MTRAILLLPLLLAACTASVIPSGERGRLAAIFGGTPEPEPPAPLPPQVVAALPAGVPQSVVTRNADGCYLITIEQTDPPSGYPLEDAAGNPVCDGSPVAGPAASVRPADAPPPLAPAPGVVGAGSITPPAPIVPPQQG